jgi:hypothetical protein
MDQTLTHRSEESPLRIYSPQSSSDEEEDSIDSENTLSEGEVYTPEYGFFSEGEVLVLPSTKLQSRIPLRMDTITPADIWNLSSSRESLGEVPLTMGAMPTKLSTESLLSEGEIKL